MRLVALLTAARAALVSYLCTARLTNRVTAQELVLAWPHTAHSTNKVTDHLQDES